MWDRYVLHQTESPVQHKGSDWCLGRVRVTAFSKWGGGFSTDKAHCLRDLLYMLR